MVLLEAGAGRKKLVTWPSPGFQLLAAGISIRVGWANLGLRSS